jgi:hypothetical protein
MVIPAGQSTSSGLFAWLHPCLRQLLCWLENDPSSFRIIEPTMRTRYRAAAPSRAWRSAFVRLEWPDTDVSPASAETPTIKGHKKITLARATTQKTGEL